MRTLDVCVEYEASAFVGSESASVRVAAQRFQGWVGLCIEDGMPWFDNNF